MKKTAIAIIAGLLAGAAACSSSGTIHGGSGADGDGQNAPAISGHAAVGGLIGGSSGGSSGGSAPDISGLSPQQIAGKTDSGVCQQVTSAISDGETAMDNADFDTPGEVKAYRGVADKLSALQGQETGPVALTSAAAVLHLRIAANELSQPGKIPMMTKDDLDFTAGACTKGVSNAATGDKLGACAQIEHAFSDIDAKLAGEVGDAATFKADAAAAAKTASALKPMAEKADPGYNLASYVMIVSEAYQQVDPANQQSAYQFGNAAEGIAEACDGGVKLF